MAGQIQEIVLPLRLLAVGDVHLGKLPSRLPPALLSRAREAGPAGTWDRLTDFALNHQIHGVVFAGDLVEGEQDFFEASRTLHHGVSRMVRSGIRVLGVAGNHDVRVLPRLAKQVKEFELLGAEGTWQKTTLEAEREHLHLWGWSFPKPIWQESPLENFPFIAGEPGPNIGVLHCDRDQSDSSFAPVTSNELKYAGPDAWLLGHIHKPDALSIHNPSGYLGSVTGTDPGEPGTHGPWLLTVTDHHIQSIEQIPLASMQWERLRVQTDGATSLSTIEERTMEACMKLDCSISSRENPPVAVGLRIVFVGSGPFGHRLQELISTQSREHFFTGAGGSHYFIEKVIFETKPAISLKEIAKGQHPPGLLAQRLLLLEAGPENEERQKILAEARDKMLTISQESRWSGTGVLVPSDPELAQYLRRSGLALLEQLLLQKKEF